MQKQASSHRTLQGQVGSETFADADESCVGGVLSADDHRLLNGRQLVDRLGVKYDFFKDMKLAGFQPPIAGLTTATYAWNWLNKNPNFREDARILKLSRKPKLVVNPRRRDVGRSDALRLKRGGQRSSQRTQRIPLESAA